MQLINFVSLLSEKFQILWISDQNFCVNIANINHWWLFCKTIYFYVLKSFLRKHKNLLVFRVTCLTSSDVWKDYIANVSFLCCKKTPSEFTFLYYFLVIFDLISKMLITLAVDFGLDCCQERAESLVSKNSFPKFHVNKASKSKNRIHSGLILRFLDVRSNFCQLL